MPEYQYIYNFINVHLVLCPLDHLIIGVEILGIEIFGIVFDLCPPAISKSYFQFEKLIFDNAHQQGFRRQYFLIVLYLFHNGFIFCMELVLFQAGQLPQTHFHNCSGLNFRQVEPLHKPFPGFIRGFGTPDDGDNLVDVVAGNDQSFEDMCPFFSLLQFIAGSPCDHILPVFHKIADQLFQVEHPWSAVDKSDVVDIK